MARRWFSAIAARTPKAMQATGHTAGPLPPAHKLPRETRDTLFLLATAGWIAAMQAPHLPVWATLAALLLLLWRAWLGWRQQAQPSGALRVAILVACVTATAVQFGTVVGKDAGSTLIVLLLTLKTLEIKARRDAFVIFFLGFFTLLSHFFYSQSLLTATGILLGVVALLTALINAQLQAGYPPLRQSLRIALRMAAMGTPLMMALFMLFPRFAPLWGLPASDSAKTGLSDHMSVGNVAQLAQDGSVAMRIRFEGPPPSQDTLYFRGPVLTRFDGQNWTMAPEALLSSSAPGPVPHLADLQAGSPPVQYEVLLQPHQKQWLLALDMAIAPPSLPAGWQVRQMPTLEWTTTRPVSDVLRYHASSHFTYEAGAGAAPQDLHAYTVLPAGSNPRTRELAQQMLADPALAGASPPQLVQAALNRLRTGGYTYTLEPGLAGPHGADTLWFDSKQGFCEHFANAFVVLMRNLAIPARVVTGYQGGERNEVDGMWTVRQSDAHAWTEVWLAGRGWVRVDPTAAVAPSRVGSFSRLEPAPGMIGNVVQTISPGLAATLGRTLRNVWDATNSRWNSWVLNYTQDRQFDLLRQLGFSQTDWITLVQILMAVLVGMAGAVALWSLWEKRQHDPWLRLLEQAGSKLARSGLTLPADSPAMTPGQLGALLQQAAGKDPATHAPPAWLSGWQQWLAAMESLRYARPAAAPQGSLRQRLKPLARQLRTLPRPVVTPSRRMGYPLKGR